MTDHSRRRFLKNAFCAGLAVPSALSRLFSPSLRSGLIRNMEMPTRRLGRTGIRISEISLGGSPLPDWPLLLSIVDRGVNYIDASHNYSNGNVERTIGRLLKTAGRDKLTVATKFHLNKGWSEDSIIRSVEGSLGRLDIETIDVLLIHGASDEKEIVDQRVLSAFERMKRDGKFRFNGLSCHTNQPLVVRQAVESGHYDMVQIAYNVFDGQEIQEGAPVVDDYLGRSGLGRLIRLAASRDVGVIAMKTLKSGGRIQNLDSFRKQGVSLYQAMIRWVLSNPDVSSVVTEMLTFEQMEEDLAAVEGVLSAGERRMLDRLVSLTQADHCRMCGTCRTACPRGIEIPEILHSLAYLESYRKKDRAQELFASLGGAGNTADCGSCGICEAACPWGVNITAQLGRAAARLA